ncbi:HNH endonuclease signature motif containing protein [Sphingomonas sp. Leaf23]|uniref:HNH endonuclease signature motif containing protein n=1 Tax=Sphingomonas sp. Leaf23 TaxID=1735689 RepID=UPI0009EA5392|nr:HNH endonuclease signature motif containing protein [Sphingomonas sp. Leaf23]
MPAVWKPVPSLPGVMVSDVGQILLPPRSAPLPNGGYRTYIPEPTFGCVRRAKKGAAHEYLGISNRIFGNIKVHRAVCEAFHGLPPSESSVVLHLDENALNNRPDNLRWGTQRENMNAPGHKAYCASVCKRKMQGGRVSA